ncbi:MAG: hypothetical protein R3246_09500 [Acidimicrobiia bacterium]|nr:hypothetical protein [Acidimicrobiia bacterium]
MRRVTTVFAALSLIATLGGVVPTVAADADPLRQAQRCGDPSYVTGVGWACEIDPSFYEVSFPDGYSTTTHGLDVFSNIHGFKDLELAKRRKPSCVTDTENQYHVQIIYTSTTDRPDRFASKIGEIRRWIERINGFLYEEGAERGRPMKYRMSCVGGEISVINAQLPISSGPGQGVLGLVDRSNYMTYVWALRQAGYTNPLAKYWLYVDAPSGAPGVAGTATMMRDDRLRADNANNLGPGYGVFWGEASSGQAFEEAFIYEAMMHEAQHLFGAVQPSAPNSTGVSHCLDDLDVMCYDEQDPAGGRLEIVCSRLHFDCGHDDYFDPKPSKNEYLASHWNFGSPLNRFAAGCLYKTGVMTVGTAGVDVDATAREAIGSDWSNLSKRSFSIKKKCRGRPFAVTGAYNPRPSQADGVIGLTPDLQGFVGIATGNNLLSGFGNEDQFLNKWVEPDFNVCFYKNSKQLKCFSETDPATLADNDPPVAQAGVSWWAEGKVPTGANKALVTFNQGAQGIYIFSII